MAAWLGALTIIFNFPAALVLRPPKEVGVGEVGEE